MGRLKRKRGKASVSRCEHRMQNWFKLLDYSLCCGNKYRYRGYSLILHGNEHNLPTFVEKSTTHAVTIVSAISDADY